MLSVHVQKLQDFYMIRFESQEEFHDAIKPFVIGSEMGNFTAISPSNYINFLKVVRKYHGKKVMVHESQCFDSQEPESPFMSTNQTSSRFIEDILKSMGVEEEGSSEEATSTKREYSPSRSPSRISKKLTTDIVYLQENLNNDLIRVSFKYDEDLISKIKSIDGRKYIVEEKIWTVPRDKKNLLIKIIQNLGKTFTIEIFV